MDANISNMDSVQDINYSIVRTTLSENSNSVLFQGTTSALSNSQSDLATLLYIMDIVYVILYAVICIIGLGGNTLVIFTVACFTRLKTVTNLFILNVAVADVLFLCGLPFLATTTLVKQWIFGDVFCRVYFTLTSINIFTCVFLLAAMSVDRYLAVCHPVSAMEYRTPRKCIILCASVWVASFLVMLPIIMYAQTSDNPFMPDRQSCSILWPANQPVPPDKAFTWYSFILGFAVPIPVITVCYSLTVLRLRNSGPKQSRNKKKSRRKVTRIVLTVITVYILCWLPHWSFQLHLTLSSSTYDSPTPRWQIMLYGFFTILSYSNSMLNPFIYVFCSHTYRQSFITMFKCLPTLRGNNLPPQTSTTNFRRRSSQLDEEELEQRLAMRELRV